MNATASISINKPIGEVFRFITDVEQMPRWMTGVRSARLLSDRMGVGSRFMVEYVNGMRPADIEIEVTELETPTVFATKTSRGPFAYEGRMVLVESEDGTDVTNIIEAGPDSLSTRVASVLFGRWISRSFVRRLHGELEALRSAIAGMSSRS